jgi:hypothetical protein
MDTSRITRKADELKDRAVLTLPIRQRPMWQTAVMWLAGGLALAAAAGLLLDRGRRREAVDRAMAAGREVTGWSGKKARHLRNKAMAAVAEMRSAREETTASGGGY